MQTPRNDQALRADYVRASQESAPHADKQEARGHTSDTAQEPQPHRPEQVRATTGRVTDSGGMEAQQALANDLMKQNHANASIRQGAQPDMSANSPSAEQKGDKAQLSADLKNARESASSPAQGRDESQAHPADNAPAQRDASISGEGASKAALAADLKDARENTHAQEQARDPSPSR